MSAVSNRARRYTSITMWDNCALDSEMLSPRLLNAHGTPHRQIMESRVPLTCRRRAKARWSCIIPVTLLISTASSLQAFLFRPIKQASTRTPSVTNTNDQDHTHQQTGNNTKLSRVAHLTNAPSHDSPSPHHDQHPDPPEPQLERRPQPRRLPRHEPSLPPAQATRA